MSFFSLFFIVLSFVRYVECTSSAILALALFKELYPEYRPKDIETCITKALDYIQITQNPDGSWYILCILFPSLRIMFFRLEKILLFLCFINMVKHFFFFLLYITKSNTINGSKRTRKLCAQVWMLGNLLHLWDMVCCRRIGNVWEEL